MDASKVESDDPKERSLYQQVADYINNEFGDSLLSLRKSKSLYETLYKDKEEITTKLSVASDEVPSKLSQALKEVDNIMARMEELQKLQEQFNSQVTTHLARVEPIVNDLKQPIEEITLIEHYISYLQWIQRVHDSSSEIQTALLVKSESRAVSCFCHLVHIRCSLADSKCLHLVNFVQVTVQFWHQLLKDKFTAEFEDVLKLIKWPFLQLIPVEAVQSPEPEILDKLEILSIHLFRIQLPDSISSCNAANSSSLPSPRSIVLPMQLLLRPLKKRFFYHFQTNKETNNLEKPEWYYTQVLAWIRDHSLFLDNTIQKIFDKAGMHGVNAKVEFMYGLVQLVIDKLSSSIDTILFDDELLSHTINETLLFENELRANGYPLVYPNCLMVLTNEQCFTRWINMERKSAVEKVDKIMMSNGAWQPRFQDHGELDELRVPECGESFMTLIRTITDRYKALPQPGHRLQFLDLQLELLDDFRLRLQQLHKEEAREPVDSNYCAILNSCYYITQVLRDWSEMTFFLQMQYYKTQYENVQSTLQLQKSTPSPTFDVYDSRHSESSEERQVISQAKMQREALDSLQEDFSEDKLDFTVGTVFENIVDLFEHMKDDMLRKLADYIVTEVKAKTKPYRSDKWFSMPSQKDFIVPTLSSTACSMLMMLKVHLHTIKNSLSHFLFHKLWQLIAEEFNIYLYRELILRNKFNEGGAAQVHFDITRNLFPIFGEFTRKPENFFKELKEACILLVLPKGSAILLQDALKAISSYDTSAPKKALEEFGVYKLPPVEASKVLLLRTDLTL